MKFTIVITTYNRVSLLRRAIDSALAQTLPCEVLVVDDCSKDGTEEHVRGLSEALSASKDYRLVYHRNASNLGHSETVNAGVQLAKGEWIKLLDDDDYLAPNCIEEMERSIALRSQAVICSCQAAQVDTNEQELSCTREVGPGKAFYIPQEDIHYGMLLELVPFGTPAQVAFRRDAFLKSGGWDSSLDTNCDDIDSWIRIAQFGDAIFINQCLAYRTIWENAYNHKFSLEKRLDTNILMKKKIYNCISENHQSKVPDIEHIRNYLKLHWSGVSLKQKKYAIALKMAWPALLSPAAWKLFIQTLLSRQFNNLASSNIIEPKIFRQLNEPESSQKVSQNETSQRDPEEVRAYLKLRCSQVAFKQGKIITGLQLGLQFLYWLGIRKFTRSRTLSHHHHHPLYSLSEQLGSNVSVIDHLYALVNAKHRSHIPEIQQIRDYFKLRCSWATLKEGKIITALKIAIPSILSIKAWKLFIKAVISVQQDQEQSLIRKIVLIDS